MSLVHMGRLRPRTPLSYQRAGSAFFTGARCMDGAHAAAFLTDFLILGPFACSETSCSPNMWDTGVIFHTAPPLAFSPLHGGFSLSLTLSVYSSLSHSLLSVCVCVCVCVCARTHTHTHTEPFQMLCLGAGVWVERHREMEEKRERKRERERLHQHSWTTASANNSLTEA